MRVTARASALTVLPEAHPLRTPARWLRRRGLVALVEARRHRVPPVLGPGWQTLAGPVLVLQQGRADLCGRDAGAAAHPLGRGVPRNVVGVDQFVVEPRARIAGDAILERGGGRGVPG